MIRSESETRTASTRAAEIWLSRSARLWFLVAVVGQAAFVWMIAAYYGRRTVAGDFANWNDKPIIKGYVAGDGLGNAMFGAHVLLAAVVTIGGLMQLVPAIRRRAPALHRWNGRMFLVIAYVMALGGLWLTWVRHTFLSLISGIAVTLDGVLILLFATIAWRMARVRNFEAHRRWALRTFMVVNGVWFLRIGLMAWVLASGGGPGMNETMSGPADIIIQFGAYLVPLAVLEAYFVGQRNNLALTKYLIGGTVLLMTIVTALGIFGAVSFMWSPYI